MPTSGDAAFFYVFVLNSYDAEKTEESVAQAAKKLTSVASGRMLCSSKTHCSSEYEMGDFDCLYAQHFPAVFRYALRCVGRRDIAEEISADAFVALYRNLEGIDTTRLPGWLLTVVHRRAADFWRRTELERRALSAAEDMNQEAKPAASGEDAMGMWLLQSCQSLKPAHRTCLLLRFVYGMSRSEISRELGLTENQVKSNLQYALELLRNSLVEKPAAASK